MRTYAHTCSVASPFPSYGHSDTYPPPAVYDLCPPYLWWQQRPRRALRLCVLVRVDLFGGGGGDYVPPGDPTVTFVIFCIIIVERLCFYSLVLVSSQNSSECFWLALLHYIGTCRLLNFLYEHSSKRPLVSFLGDVILPKSSSSIGQNYKKFLLSSSIATAVTEPLWAGKCVDLLLCLAVRVIYSGWTFLIPVASYLPKVDFTLYL